MHCNINDVPSFLSASCIMKANLTLSEEDWVITPFVHTEMYMMGTDARIPICDKKYPKPNKYTRK